MKKSFLALFALVLFAFGLSGCKNGSEEKKVEQNEAKTVYQCPMDCEKGRTYEKPGQCPVCGMDIEKAPLKS